jgi:hypothetical protein
LTAIPVEVGARQNPVASAEVNENPTSMQSDMPIRMGVHEPKHAVMIPLMKQSKFPQTKKQSRIEQN